MKILNMKKIIARNERILYLYISLVISVIPFLHHLVFKLGEVGELLNQNDLFIYLIITICIFFILRFYIPKILHNYIFNKKFTFLVLYVCLVYLIIRIFDFELLFAPYNDSIKFADIILILLLVHLVVIIKAYKKEIEVNKSKDQNVENNKHYFIQDTLFIDGEIDNEKILQRLLNMVDRFMPENAFSIGLNAVWGYGKSTFLKRFELQFKFNNPEGIVFWNHIWKNKGPQAVIENFFEEFKANLKPHSSSISNTMDKYVEAVLSLTPSEFSKYLKYGIEFLSDHETLEQYYIEINRQIRIIDRQIIILLDDLDRLEKEEILSTLKLIRTISDFNNVIFIAGYDRRYITKHLPFEDGRYLDKVFNVELNLLPFQTERIRRELIELAKVQYPITEKSELNIVLNGAFRTLLDTDPKFEYKLGEINFVENKNLIPKIVLEYSHFLKTFRDVKRFLNEFKFNYSFIDNENDVNLQEYLLLKLCGYKYRPVQNLILTKLDTILGKARLDEVNGKLVENFEFDSHDVYIYDENSRSKCRNILQKENFEEEDIFVIDAVMIRLFGKRPIDFYRKNQNSISKIYYTSLYIRNDIAGGNISISKMQNAHENNNLFTIANEIFEKRSSDNSQIMFEMKQFLIKLEIHSIKEFKDIFSSLNLVMTSVSLKEDQEVLNKIDDVLIKIYNNNIEKMIHCIGDIIAINHIGYLDQLLAMLNTNIQRRKKTELYDGIYPYSSKSFSEDILQELLFDKLKYSFKNDITMAGVIWLFFQNIKHIILDKKTLRSKKSIINMKKDIEERVFIYFVGDILDFKPDRFGHGEEEFVYQPNFYLSEIFGNQDEYDELITNTSLESYKMYHNHGWDNYYKFLNKIGEIPAQSGEYNQERFQKIKILTNLFIKNNYTPLSSKTYNQVWQSKPKEVELYEIF